MLPLHRLAAPRTSAPAGDPDEGPLLRARAADEVARARRLLADAERLRRTAAQLRSGAASARVDARLVRAQLPERAAPV